MGSMLSVFLTAVVGGVVLTPLARKLANRWEIVDRPDGKRKLHIAPVPLGGGVAVYVSVAITVVLAMFLSWPDIQLVELSLVVIPVAGFVCMFGFLDDCVNLSPRSKLVLQIAATIPIVVAGYYVENVSVFGMTWQLGWLGVPLTVFWLVGCINALNLLDGMDGLASVVGVATAAMIALIAAATGREHVATLAIALSGALVGFLAYNLPPATIYLGDSGSMVIGLFVGTLALQGSLKSSATLSITIPAVIMTIPMLDSALAIIRRRLTGLRFDVGDRGHIHHRLLERGMGAWKALCIIGALCLATGAAAATATMIRSDALGWIVAISVIVLLVRLKVFGHHEVALVKLSVANLFAHIAHRMMDSARSIAHVGSISLDELTFDQSWARLLEEVRHCEIDFLRLELGFENAPETIDKEWSDNSANCLSHWSFVVQAAGKHQRYCRITVNSQRTPDPALLYRLTSTLRLFGKHFLQHPKAFAPQVLPWSEQPALPARRQAAA